MANLKHGLRAKKRTDWDSMNDVAGAVQNLLGEKQAAPAAEPVDTSQPASKTLTEAQSYVEAADDFRQSGGAVDQMAGDLNARDEFMENYKFNVKKRMEPGVAHSTGNDKLGAGPDKISNIASSIVGKNAGKLSV